MFRCLIMYVLKLEGSLSFLHIFKNKRLDCVCFQDVIRSTKKKWIPKQSTRISFSGLDLTTYEIVAANS